MNYTVIVAEDEELLLNNLVHKIEKADPDFQVIGTAQTGAQALSLVEQMSPDVVFTDIKMFSLRSNRNFRSNVMTTKPYSPQVLPACHRDRLQSFSRTSWYRIMQRIST